MTWRAAMTCLVVASGAIAACDAFGTEGANAPTADAGSLLPDGGTGATTEPDAGTDATVADAGTEPTGARCDPRKPFGTPVAVTGFANSKLITGFRLTPDEKEAYFSSLGKLHRARMVALDQISTDVAELSVTGQPLNAVNSFFVTDDGATLYLEQNFNLWRATKKGGAYPDASVIPETNFRSFPYYDSQTGHLYAAKYLADFVLDRVERAKVSDGGTIGPLEQIVFSDVKGTWTTPVPNGSTLYVGGISDADSGTGTDVFRREGAGPTTRVVEVSSRAKDSPAWVSRDDCVLYVRSSRNTQGEDEVFVAMRPK